ncbi:MAG TPA: AAA family ATPase [Acidimicrobiales bacterium]|nr:AAA family ATPase [Acidimicrobiales bacterium]
MNHRDGPLVGRDELADELVGGLAGGGRARAVLLTGPAGIGKSRLAEHVAGHLARRIAPGTAGSPPVMVRADPGSAAIPFAALVPLLVALDVDPAQGEAVALLAGLRRAVAERSTPLVIVVDDVPALDAASAVALATVLREPAVRAVLTARDGQALPDALGALVRDQLAWVRPVPPLDRTASDAVAEVVLGRTLDPGSALVLHETAGGNPLFVGELLAASHAAGRLEDGPHGIRLVGPVVGDVLVDLLAERFRSLRGPRREVVELLAAGQPLPLVGLVGDPTVVDDLEEDGLVRTDVVGDETLVRLSHPLHADVVRALAPPARWRRRVSEAAEVLLARGHVEDRLRATDLRLGIGTEIDSGELVEAARRAAGLLDHDLALRMADAALTAGAGLEADLLRAGAMSDLGRLAEADEAFADLVGRAGPDEDRARAASRWAKHLAVRRQRPDLAVGVATDALATVADPGWRAYIEADLAKWGLMAGEVRTPVSDGDGAEGAARLNLLLADALLGVMAGRLSAAETAVAEGLVLAADHRDELPHAAELLALSHYLVFAFRGDAASARSLAEVGLARADALRDEPIGMWEAALALLELHRGRPTAALGRADRALEHLAWRDYTGLGPLARAVAATAAAQLGRLAEAEAHLAAIEPATRADLTVALQVGSAEAWSLAAQGHRRDATGPLAAVAVTALASTHVCLGALAALDTIRLGGAALVADALSAAAAIADADAGVVHAVAAAAAALTDGDDHAVVAAGEGLVAVGLVPGGVELLGEAARRHRRAGRSALARRAEQRVTALAPSLEVASASTARPVLNGVELEVARLAAARWRSREIAERRGVSVRTVDNQLSRVYRKLGIAGRAELGDALADRGLLGADGPPPGTE